MAPTIWKYVLGATDVQVVSIPEDSRVLHFGNQYDRPTVWVEVDPEKPPSARTFTMVGTGHDIPVDAGRYVGTAIFNDGRFVFHLYEREQ